MRGVRRRAKVLFREVDADAVFVDDDFAVRFQVEGEGDSSFFLIERAIVLAAGGSPVRVPGGRSSSPARSRRGRPAPDT
jgi:hypothetical protein